MARPERNNVDYFPFICEDGNKMFYIEETYGNDGFATFVKLLRELAKTNYHYLDLSKPTTQMFLSAKCKVSKEILLSIIKDLVDLGKFDKLLWEENSIIWCQDFIDSIQDAYIKRKNNCISYDSLLQLLIGLGLRKQIKSKPIVPINPQSKEEDSIEDEIKDGDINELGILLLKPKKEKRKKVAPKKEINLPSGFTEIWDLWIEYRIAKKIKNYANDKFEQMAIDKLIKLSNNNPAIAKEIINESITNSWTGFFELKNKPNDGTQNRPNRNR